MRAIALEVTPQNFETVQCLEVSWFTQLERGERGGEQLQYSLLNDGLPKWLQEMDARQRLTWM